MTGYGDGVLSDARIAAMSPDERRDLIQRLQRPLDEVHPPPIARRMRRNRLTLMVGGAIGLIPWIVYLGFTLPANYVAHNWPAALFLRGPCPIRIRCACGRCCWAFIRRSCSREGLRPPLCGPGGQSRLTFGFCFVFCR